MFSRIKRAAIVLACLTLAGCPANRDVSIIDLFHGMNDAGIKSCNDTDLNVSGVSGIVNGNIRSKGLLITGEMTAEECANYRKAVSGSGE